MCLLCSRRFAISFTNISLFNFYQPWKLVIPILQTRQLNLRMDKFLMLHRIWRTGLGFKPRSNTQPDPAITPPTPQATLFLVLTPCFLWETPGKSLYLHVAGLCHCSASPPWHIIFPFMLVTLLIIRTCNSAWGLSSTFGASSAPAQDRPYVPGNYHSPPT